MANEIVVGVALSHIRRSSEKDEECSKNLLFSSSYTILILSEEYHLSYKLRVLYEENNKQLIVSRLRVGLGSCRKKP